MLTVNGEAVSVDECYIGESVDVQLELSDYDGANYTHRCNNDGGCEAQTSEPEQEGAPECPGRECEYCDGIGQEDVEPDACEFCNGVGAVLSAECEHCNGTGKDYMSIPDCRECNGTGQSVHNWEPIPLTWCNHASITVDPDNDTVALSLSIGDPRGALQLVARRTDDGRILLHVPTEREWHVRLTPVSDDTYQVTG